MTGQTICAYCHQNLVGDFQSWLMLSVDHVVPGGQARILEIPIEFYEDAINLVLCCSACNGFGNRYACVAETPANWNIDAFCELRDATFLDRFKRIKIRRDAERLLFEAKPWLDQPARSKAPGLL